ncbi:MAG: arsenical pump-driving ATPase [Acidobacteria bacterium]|nr:arsenical pump-driving ATPase [Acidobacteriota bacterium]
MSIPVHTRNLLFTGKGGVGKTSTACATAIQLADAGRKVLLVSTDPASNLDEVLGARLNGEPTALAGIPGLWAMNIDPEAAAAAYRERVVGPYRELLPPAAVTSIEEQLSGACTLEIAAFDEFSKLLGTPSGDWVFDHLVFDTAPTGHTLRLMELPAAWSDFLADNQGGTSCLGPLSGLKNQQRLYAEARAALGDPARTLVVLVTRPEPAALQEAERTRFELGQLGIGNHHLVVNGVFKATDPHDEIALALEARGKLALAGMPAALETLPRTEVSLKSMNLLGPDRLRALFQEPAPQPQLPVTEDLGIPSSQSSWQSLIHSLLEAPGGVLLTMGKGGVGKTSVARRLARDLSAAGRRVHLTTTDPAGGNDLPHAGDTTSRLTISRIDPEAETAAYTEEVIDQAGRDLDPAGRALLEEDLRSPCTAEIAVFRAFAKEVARGLEGFVVIDTAPTGHTLLLLDAAEAYHREVSRTAQELPEEVRTLLPRLRDPRFTKVILVALPEATPVHEAKGLEQDLRRAGIQPFAWILNQSLSPLRLTDPILQARAQAERTYLQEVASFGFPWTVLPWMENPSADLMEAAPEVESSIHP